MTFKITGFDFVSLESSLNVLTSQYSDDAYFNETIPILALFYIESKVTIWQVRAVSGERLQYVPYRTDIP